MSSPFEMPPSIPPALLCSRRKARMCRSRLPRRSRLRHAPLSRRTPPPSRRAPAPLLLPPAATSPPRPAGHPAARPNWHRCRAPGGTPCTTTSKTPPMESPVRSARSTSAFICSSISGSTQFSRTSSLPASAAICSQVAALRVPRGPHGPLARHLDAQKRSSSFAMPPQLHARSIHAPMPAPAHSGHL